MSTKNFGSFIKARRIELGFTQEDVINTFKTSTAKTKSAYSKYESGSFVDISPEMLKELCTVLQIDYSKAALRLMVDKYEPEKSAIEQHADIEVARWDLMTAIVERKSKIRNILDIDKDTQDKLLAHEIRAHIKSLTDNIVLDMSGLALWEKNLIGENNFWIASSHLFDGSGNDFFSAVIQQLKQGSRYTFFIPKNLTGFNFKTLTSELKKHLGSDSVPAIRAIPLEDDEVWKLLRGNAYVIANPTSSNRQFGFICTVNDHFPQLAYEMHDARPLRDYLGNLAINFAGQDSDLMSHVTNP